MDNKGLGVIAFMLILCMFVGAVAGKAIFEKHLYEKCHRTFSLHIADNNPEMAYDDVSESAHDTCRLLVREGFFHEKDN